MALRTLNRRAALGLLSAGLVRGQAPVQWVCPMDPDVRSAKPERCRKCGMQLVAGIPDPVEYPVSLSVTPQSPKPGEPITLQFRVAGPKLQLIHEKFFHLFVISKDLSVFRHEHPELQTDGSLIHRITLPNGGMYRLLCDFYPEGGTPQMTPKTIFLQGASATSALTADLRPQTASNIRMSLRLDPEQPLAGKKTMMFFELDPPDGLEQYLGAWGHLLGASSDLIDMIHTHPAWEERTSNVQFNLIFPRPGIHRVWVQFQRQGVINTAAFNIPVSEL
jgi:hypothetical protein